ncbi:MAG: glutaredoxin domain-containing protein [Nitriliruptoraceae bacterium]
MTDVTVYWRPGCSFCASLLDALDRAGLAYERSNIWDDPDAARVVREAADGNETVPTVRIGDKMWVNPTAREVLDQVYANDPDLLAGTYQPSEPSGLARLFNRLLGG